jgi:AraC-like DNA-binding protein
MTNTNPVHRYPTITPHLGVDDPAAAADFYKRAFDAQELVRLALPDGTIAHAEMLVGDALVTLGKAIPEYHLAAPSPDEPVQVSITYFTHADVTRVEQVARHFGVCSRTLQRRFERYLGVGPKWVIQRRRIHDALEEIEHGRATDWAALALRLGDADQAHFVHAFTELVGRPPASYERH